MSTVRTNGHSLVDVTPLREAGGLMLHAAIGRASGFTVSHAKTGSSIFTGQPRDVAERFFNDASKWPEWEQGKSIGDFQCLRARVEALREEAKFVSYVLAR